jgi:hypothetical protein
MSEDASFLYTAVYEDKEAALDDLDVLDGLHEHELVGRYDAAVIANVDGDPHIVMRVDRPSIREIPELFGAGTLRRHELHEAARRLDAGQAALVVVGEPTLEEGFDEAAAHAARVVKQRFDSATDELAEALSGATRR